jgi:cold shock protein
MASGTVKWWNDAKGYGFIAPTDRGADLFVHFTALVMPGFKTLKEGQTVDFDVVRGTKGIQASAVRPRPLSPPPPNRRAATEESVLARLFRAAAGIFAQEEVNVEITELADVVPAHELAPQVLEQASESSISVKKAFDAKLLDILKRNPQLMHSLPGNVFEELIAEVLASLGFADISLRVTTEFGEVDILGYTKDHFGSRIAYLFELKQLGKSRRHVALKEVTRLFGIREGLRQRLGLAQGVFVTTTDYTDPAREMGEIHALSLKSYDDLVDWLEEYKPNPNGLYLRDQHTTIIRPPLTN